MSRKVLIVVLFMIGILSASAQDSQIAVENYEKGIEAFRKGKLKNAIRFFTICNENRSKEEYHYYTTSNAYQWLAHCYFLSGDEVKAIESDPLYYQVQPEDLRTCESSVLLENERMVLEKEGDFAKAFAKTIEMLEHDRKTFGDNHIFVGNDLWTISQVAFRCDDSSIKSQAYNYMEMAETYFKENYPQCINLLTYIVLDKAYAYYYDRNFNSASMLLEEYFSKYHGKHTYTIQEIYAHRLQAFLQIESQNYEDATKTFLSVIENSRYKKEKGEYEMVMNEFTEYLTYTNDPEAEYWLKYKSEYMADNHGKASLQYVKTISELTDLYYNQADYLKNLSLCTTFMASVQHSPIMDALTKEAQMDDLFEANTDSLMLTPILNIVSKMIDACSNQPDTDWGFLDTIYSVFYEDDGTWSEHSDTPLGKSMKELFLSIQQKRSELMYTAGKRQESIAMLEDMLRMEVYKKDSVAYTEILNQCGMCYLFDGKLDEAINLMEKSLSYSPDNMTIKQNLASMYAFKPEYNLKTEELAAESYAQNYAFVVSGILSTTKTNREILWESFRPRFEGYCTLSVMKDGRDDILNRVAYNSLLLSRGFLLKSDAYFQQKIRDTKNPKLTEYLQELSQIERISTSPDNAKEVLERKIFLDSEILKAVKEMENNSDDFKSDWRDVQKALPDNGIACEFFYQNAGVFSPIESYYALVIKKGWESPRLVKLDVANDVSVASLDRLYSTDKLYKAIWERIIKETGIKEGGSIYFAVDNEFLYIALEYAMTQQGENMFSLYDMHRLSSTGELCNNYVSEKTSSIVLYGDLNYNQENITSSGTNKQRAAEQGLISLPGTKEEIEQISRQFRESIPNGVVKMYTGDEGTEASFRSFDNNSYFIIHLATHGGFLGSQRNAMDNASLFFAGSEPAYLDENHTLSADDGILTASEIALMDLSATNLVTLSACQSALGFVESDGVFGLQRGFKLAGVRSILMTLWEVEDEATSRFMIEFYKNYFNGKSKQESLTKAQNLIRHNLFHPEWSNPKYWAPFILLDGLD